MIICFFLRVTEYVLDAANGVKGYSERSGDTRMTPVEVWTKFCLECYEKFEVWD
jgi:hypothetical protein